MSEPTPGPSSQMKSVKSTKHPVKIQWVKTDPSAPDPTPEEMAEIAIKTLEKIELNVKKKKEISGEVQCDICWKFYKNKTTLNSHKANTHKEELTTCDICKKFCKTKSLLTR